MFLIPTEFNRKVVDRKNNCEDHWLEDSYTATATQIVQTREIQELADIYNILQCVGWFRYNLQKC